MTARRGILGARLLVLALGCACAGPPTDGGVPSTKVPSARTSLTRAEELDLRMAFLAASAAEVAYQEARDLEALVEEMGVDRYRFIESEGKDADTQCFVATVGQHSLVAFRGTAGLRDWGTNTRIATGEVRLGDGTNARVHGGFLGAWRDVQPRVLDVLGDVEVEVAGHELCHEVIVAGHSLGGALALLCGIELERAGYHVLGVYTFGQPKVFTHPVDERALPHLMRFVYGDDVVPTLPPWGGYVHVGAEAYSPQIGRILAEPRPFSWWPSLSVRDHGAVGYMGTIAALMHELADDDESRGMVAWVERREAPLSSYLGLDRTVRTPNGTCAVLREGPGPKR